MCTSEARLGKIPDDVRSSLDLFVQPLDRVRRVQPAPSDGRAERRSCERSPRRCPAPSWEPGEQVSHEVHATDSRCQLPGDPNVVGNASAWHVLPSSLSDGRMHEGAIGEARGPSRRRTRPRTPPASPRTIRGAHRSRRPPPCRGTGDGFRGAWPPPHICERDPCRPRGLGTRVGPIAPPATARAPAGCPCCDRRGSPSPPARRPRTPPRRKGSLLVAPRRCNSGSRSRATVGYPTVDATPRSPGRGQGDLRAVRSW
jgi:hypothetical protein